MLWSDVQVEVENIHFLLIIEDKGSQLVWVICPDFRSKSFVVLSKFSNPLPQMECRRGLGWYLRLMLEKPTVSWRRRRKECGDMVMANFRITKLLVSGISTRLPRTRLIASFDLWYGYNWKKSFFFYSTTAWQLLGFWSFWNSNSTFLHCFTVKTRK